MKGVFLMIQFRSMIAADFHNEEHLENAIQSLDELISFLQEHRRQMAEELSRHIRVSASDALEDLGDM